MHGEGKYVDKQGIIWEGKFQNGKFNSDRVRI